jgi:hypothetical protein
MKFRVRIAALIIASAFLMLISACRAGDAPARVEPAETPQIVQTPEPSPSPTVQKIPNLQAELLSGKSSTTESPIGRFDFMNHTYKVPRGWQDSDGKDVELRNGRREMEMTDAVERIGFSHVATRYFDATGDGQDEAVVILVIETGGSAKPHVVYVFGWKNNEPEPLWHFRTGDRSDGGLKDIRIENGEFLIELYGQDRYIVGELDTAKIFGDEEQLCCPTHFTRSRYKWNGSNFRLDGKRLTFLTSDPSAPPIENMVEEVEKQNSGKK